MLGRAPLGLAGLSGDLAPRSSSPGCRPTGAAGWPRRSSRTPTVEAIIGVDRTPAEGRARAHGVRPRSPTSTRSSAASSRRREIDTVVDTRLVVDSIVTTRAARPREQRHRDDEHPRRLRGRGLAGAQGRLQVQRALLRRASRTTRPSSPRTCARRAPAADGRSSATSSRPRAPSRDFADRHPDVHGHRPALRQRARPRPAHVAHRACSACRSSRRSSASTRATSSSTRTTSPAASSTRCATTSTAPSTAPPTACSGSGRSSSLLGKPLRAGAAALGDRPGRRRAAAAPGVRMPPEMLRQLRFGRGARQPPPQGHGLPLPLHDARDGARAARAAAPGALRAGRRRRLPLRARGRGVPALQPERPARGTAGRGRGLLARRAAPSAGGDRPAGAAAGGDGFDASRRRPPRAAALAASRTTSRRCAAHEHAHAAGADRGGHRRLLRASLARQPCGGMTGRLQGFCATREARTLAAPVSKELRPHALALHRSSSSSSSSSCSASLAGGRLRLRPRAARRDRQGRHASAASTSAG